MSMQGKSAAGDATGSAKSAAGDVAGSAKSLGGDAAGSAKDAAGSVKKAGKEAAGALNEATPNLSALDDLFGKVSSYPASWLGLDQFEPFASSSQTQLDLPSPAISALRTFCLSLYSAMQTCTFPADLA